MARRHQYFAMLSSDHEERLSGSDSLDNLQNRFKMFDFRLQSNMRNLYNDSSCLAKEKLTRIIADHAQPKES